MSDDAPLPTIFVSVGHLLSPAQQQFVAALDAVLVEHGLQPVTIGRTTAAPERPLEIIRDVITLTRGTIVIAFARLKIEVASEYPGTSFEATQPPRKLPTVWNQIEAAMTWQAHRPLLIFCEKGVRHEGIIDPALFPIIPFGLNHKRNALPANVEQALRLWLRDIVP